MHAARSVRAANGMQRIRDRLPVSTFDARKNDVLLSSRVVEYYFVGVGTRDDAAQVFAVDGENKIASVEAPTESLRNACGAHRAAPVFRERNSRVERHVGVPSPDDFFLINV